MQQNTVCHLLKFKRHKQPNLYPLRCADACKQLEGAIFAALRKNNAAVACAKSSHRQLDDENILSDLAYTKNDWYGYVVELTSITDFQTNFSKTEWEKAN